MLALLPEPPPRVGVRALAGLCWNLQELPYLQFPDLANSVQALSLLGLRPLLLPLLLPRELLRLPCRGLLEPLAGERERPLEVPLWGLLDLLLFPAP